MVRSFFVSRVVKVESVILELGPILFRFLISISLCNHIIPVFPRCLVQSVVYHPSLIIIKLLLNSCLCQEKENRLGQVIHKIERVVGHSLRQHEAARGVFCVFK